MMGSYWWWWLGIDPGDEGGELGGVGKPVEAVETELAVVVAGRDGVVGEGAEAVDEALKAEEGDVFGEEVGLLRDDEVGLVLDEEAVAAEEAGGGLVKVHVHVGASP